MVSLRIDANYRGVTLIEYQPLLELGNGPVEVRWLNSKVEIDILRTIEERDVTLVVPDLVSMERAASAIGIDLVIDKSVRLRGMSALARPDGGWREFTREHSPALSRGLIVSTIGISLRHGGKDPKTMRKVAVESLLDGVSPLETDVLVGLRMKGAQV